MAAGARAASSCASPRFSAHLPAPRPGMAAAAAAQGGKVWALPGALHGGKHAERAQTREDRQREKALLEARKAGTVAPEKDADGNDINPHIPAYIAQAPWYLNATAPGLKHQKSAHTDKHDKTWYTRGATQVRSLSLRLAQAAHPLRDPRRPSTERAHAPTAVR